MSLRLQTRSYWMRLKESVIRVTQKCPKRREVIMNVIDNSSPRKYRIIGNGKVVHSQNIILQRGDGSRAWIAACNNDNEFNCITSNKRLI